MESLQRWNFPGKLCPVNHNAETVSGIKAYPDIREVPEKVDLAILAVSAEYIAETIRGCGEKGVQGITILAACFDKTIEGWAGSKSWSLLVWLIKMGCVSSGQT